MQSVLSRRRQHAISYVLARESMDRADRAQRIRLVARTVRTFLLSLSLSRSVCLRNSFRLSPRFAFSLFHLSFLLLFSLLFFFLLSFSLSGSPSEKGRAFLQQKQFSIWTKAYIFRSLLHSHECTRASDYSGRNSQLPRRVRGESRL